MQAKFSYADCHLGYFQYRSRSLQRFRQGVHAVIELPSTSAWTSWRWRVTCSKRSIGALR